MPTVRIPLIGGPTTRNPSASGLSGVSEYDQQFTNVLVQKFQNPMSGDQSFRIVARPTLEELEATPSGTGTGTSICVWTGNSSVFVSAYGSTNSTIYVEDTSAGTISGQALWIDETSINGIPVVTIVSSSNKAYFLAGDANTGSVSTAVVSSKNFTGDLHSNTTIDNITSTAGMYPGQTLTHANIPANAYIVSVDSTTQITISAAATATAAGQTIARTTIAEIKDADFPANAGKTIVGRFCHMNGYAFIMCTDGTIWHPSVNSLTTWTSSAFLSAQVYPDGGKGVYANSGRIVGIGSNSIEFFQIAGNAAGSVLSPIPGTAIAGGPRSTYSICTAANAIVFAGEVGGEIGLWFLSGINPINKASTAVREFIASTGNIIVNPVVLYGQLHIVVSFYIMASDTHSKSMAYSVSSDFWSKIDFSEAYIRQSTIVSRSGTGDCFAVGPTVGNIVRPSSGLCPAVTIRTAKLDFGTPLLKTINSIRLIGGSDSNVTVTMQWYDDDYVTASTSRTLTLGTGKTIPKLARCGMCRKRAFLISISSPRVFTSIEAIEVDYTVGAL